MGAASPSDKKVWEAISSKELKDRFKRLDQLGVEMRRVGSRNPKIRLYYPDGTTQMVSAGNSQPNRNVLLNLDKKIREIVADRAGNEELAEAEEATAHQSPSLIKAVSEVAGEPTLPPPAVPLATHHPQTAQDLANWADGPGKNLVTPEVAKDLHKLAHQNDDTTPEEPEETTVAVAEKKSEREKIVENGTRGVAGFSKGASAHAWIVLRDTPGTVWDGKSMAAELKRRGLFYSGDSSKPYTSDQAVGGMRVCFNNPRNYPGVERVTGGPLGRYAYRAAEGHGFSPQPQPPASPAPEPVASVHPITPEPQPAQKSAEDTWLVEFKVVLEDAEKGTLVRDEETKDLYWVKKV